MKQKVWKSVALVACCGIVTTAYAINCWVYSGNDCVYAGETQLVSYTCRDQNNTADTYSSDVQATADDNVAPGDYAARPKTSALVALKCRKCDFCDSGAMICRHTILEHSLQALVGLL